MQRAGHPTGHSVRPGSRPLGMNVLCCIGRKGAVLGHRDPPQYLQIIQLQLETSWWQGGDIETSSHILLTNGRAEPRSTDELHLSDRTEPPGQHEASQHRTRSGSFTGALNVVAAALPGRGALSVQPATCSFFFSQHCHLVVASCNCSQPVLLASKPEILGVLGAQSPCTSHFVWCCLHH